ncbi:MAG: peptidylprolyl isomerase, partial [Longimicrobiales bacterium]
GAGATRPERRPVPVERGVVALALDLDGGDDDLFVALDRLPELDGAHTVVGRVVEGLELLDTIDAGAVVRRVRVLR